MLLVGAVGETLDLLVIMCKRNCRQEKHYLWKRNGTTQLPVPLDTKIGMASDGRKFAVKSGREYTLSMNVATSELGDLLDYMYLMYTVEGGNRRLGDIKTTDFLSLLQSQQEVPQIIIVLS